MSKSKNRSNIKSITLAALVIIPVMITSGLLFSPVAAQGNSPQIEIQGKNITLDQLKQTVLKVINNDLKRLEKVQKRISKTNIVNKDETLNKIDTVISFLKEEKNKLGSISNTNDLNQISEDIKNTVNENNVNLGNVFDNKKDGKAEKGYDKQEKKLDKFEANLNNLNTDDQNTASQLIKKGRSIIEQLRNEDKKDKDKYLTKTLRKELANVFNQLNKLEK